MKKTYSQVDVAYIGGHIGQQKIEEVLLSLRPGQVLKISGAVSLENALVMVEKLPVGVMLQLPYSIPINIAQVFASKLPLGRILSIHEDTSAENVKCIVSALHAYSILHIHRNTPLLILQTIAKYAPAGITIELPSDIYPAAVDIVASSFVNEMGLIFRPRTPFELLMRASHYLSEKVTFFIQPCTPLDVVQYIVNMSAHTTPLIFVASIKYPELADLVEVKPSMVQSTFFNARTAKPFVCLNNPALNAGVIL